MFVWCNDYDVWYLGEDAEGGRERFMSDVCNLWSAGEQINHETLSAVTESSVTEY